ncbi:MAG: hypothetical protein WKG01_29865 [Kofleriaceae bacterium]
MPFAFPDISVRVELWRRVFPCDVPLAGFDPVALSRLQITGASIKNIATMAAFHAAHDRTAVSMLHVTAAARGEFAKLEIPFPELEMRAAGRV